MENNRERLKVVPRRDSYAHWCADVDATVEAQYSAMQASGEALPAAARAVLQPATAPAQPKPAPDAWSSEALAVRARAELRTALRKMGGFEVNLLWAMSKAIESNTGCDTPAEEFIHSLAMQYLWSLKPGSCGMTPDAAAGDLETFRDNFRDAVSLARRFNAKYPAEVQK